MEHGCRFEYDVMTALSREKVLGDGYMFSATGDLTIWSYHEYEDGLGGKRRIQRPVIAFSARCWYSIEQKEAPQ